MDDELLTRMAKVYEAFSPSAPIDRRTLFAGRSEQFAKIIQGINTRGQHITVFGERGVGKTSLVNVAAELLQSGALGRQFLVSKINCDETDNFQTLWRKVFSRITMEQKINGMGIGAADSAVHTSVLDLIGGNQAMITPFVVTNILAKLSPTPVIIFDEFDRVIDTQTTRLISDTIKALSDESVSATLVIVGVANDVGALIEGHQSIERALRQILMPRMSIEELTEVVSKGLSYLDMTMDEETALHIARMSKGLPHYTHLLALHAALSALTQNSTHITADDVSAAIKEAIENTQESISRTHHMATMSPQKGNIYAEVLLACALAPTDDRGLFTSSAVKRPLSIIKRKNYEIPSFARHLNDFADTKRGKLLDKTGASRNFRYKFAMPLMQPYVIFHGIANGLITEAEVKRLENSASRLR